MKKNRVIIIDDEPDVLDGLKAWLSQDYSVVVFDCAGAFLAAVEDIREDNTSPTCLLLDFQMPGMTGIELQTDLRLLNVQYPIVFMSGSALKKDIIEAWHGGAVDFVLKPFTAREIGETLCKAFASQAARPGEGMAQESPTDKLHSISRREAQVLILLGEGLQQQEVARTLNVSLRTVKMYRAFLKNKLDLNTLVEIGKFCEKNRGPIMKIAGFS